MFGSAGQLQVGMRNEEAVRAALRQARLPIAAADTGGSSGRTIRVYVDDARVTSRVAGGSETVLLGGPGADLMTELNVDSKERCSR
jgi:chemotaxis protein CheD